MGTIAYSSQSVFSTIHKLSLQFCVFLRISISLTLLSLHCDLNPFFPLSRPSTDLLPSYSFFGRYVHFHLSICPTVSRDSMKDRVESMSGEIITRFCNIFYTGGLKTGRALRCREKSMIAHPAFLLVDSYGRLRYPP